MPLHRALGRTGSVPAPGPAAGADPQGGRFHLLVGEQDWRTCLEPAPSPSGRGTSGEAWPERTVLAGDAVRGTGDFSFDGATGSLRLAHRESVARHPAAARQRRPDERRGADRDRHGTWYWIDGDRRGIVRLVPGARSAVPWWTLDDLDASCADARPPSNPASFAADARPLVDDGARLAGLAVTTGHRLVVGLVDGLGGLVLFDLHTRGVPLVLRWPGAHAITPFDLAATADGGALVLDRSRRTWWRLDRTWRLAADVIPGPPAAFAPADGTAAAPTDPATTPVAGLLEATGPHAVADPVAIAEGPGVVLVLDRPPAGPSAVVVCTGSAAPARLPLTVEALDPTRPDLPSFVHDVVGHDLAWAPAGTSAPLPGPLLHVADARTASCEAYRLVLDPPALVHQAEELPMRSWEAKAVVAVGGDVFYDAVGRWAPLEPFGVCNLERQATLRTPAGFTSRPVPGQPFDSGIPGCTWHRLLLDAEVPDGCAIAIGARASDDAALLAQLPFLAQPSPYLRGGGSELPWHDPWADVARRPASPRTGTWELLLQHVHGRYAQLELTLQGTGRTTPSLRALRAWYPRFSYVRAYLPEVFQEEDEPGRFLERMLANVEGMLTEQEARIEGAWALADPRTAPAGALDWLASWVGLHLEPAWPTARRRFLLEHVDRLYRMRGTVGGLRALLRAYLGCSLDADAVFAEGPRTDDPARIVDLTAPHRFRVLVPGRLDDDRAAMVARIVGAARPAHASFEIRATSGLLVVGEAQVGVDALLGESPGFSPLVLAGSALPALVGAGHPFDVADRVVSDRDRLGELPAL